MSGASTAAVEALALGVLAAPVVFIVRGGAWLDRFLGLPPQSAHHARRGFLHPADHKQSVERR